MELIRKLSAFVALALISGTAVATNIPWDYEWRVGDFYFGAMAGHAVDRGINPDTSSYQVNFNAPKPGMGSKDRISHRESLGYRHPISQNSYFLLETAWGYYGKRGAPTEISPQTASTHAYDPIFKLQYSGIDMLLGLSRQYGHHQLALKAGLMRMYVDKSMKDRNLIIGDSGNSDILLSGLSFNRAKNRTRPKVALNYEYALQERVSIMFDLSHFFGEQVYDWFSQTEGNAGMSRLASVPSVTNTGIGLNFYF